MRATPVRAPLTEMPAAHPDLRARTATSALQRVADAPVARVLPYLLPHVVLVLLTAAAVGAPTRYRVVPLALLVALAIDAAAGRGCAFAERALVTEEQKDGTAWRVVLWTVVPPYLAFMYAGLTRAAHPDTSPTDFLVTVTVVACVAAMFGITAAHELMHRPSRAERTLAAVIMATFSNAHFCWEHHQHHEDVGTPADPATARLGEGFFDYFVRSVTGGFDRVCATERARLGRRGRSGFSVHNRLLVWHLVVLAMYAAVAARFGLRGVGFLLVVGMAGLTCLQLVNYVQHYGLRRTRLGAHTFEPVSAEHSWECCLPMSNWLLFGTPRHARHHCDDHGEFRHAHARHLPCAYLPAMWLALCPPLWRRCMDHRVAAVRREDARVTHTPHTLTHEDVS